MDHGGVGPQHPVGLIALLSASYRTVIAELGARTSEPVGDPAPWPSRSREHARLRRHTTDHERTWMTCTSCSGNVELEVQMNAPPGPPVCRRCRLRMVFG